MTECICTLSGLLLGAGIFALGLLAAGQRPTRRPPDAPAAPAPETAPSGEARESTEDAGEARLRQIEADRRAFSALMGYNADVAYGLERLGGEDRT